jgi:hypothetical protein
MDNSEKMNEHQIIAGLQQGIIEDLSQNILLESISDVGLISEKLDRQLVSVIQNTLLETSPLIISNTQKSNGDIFSLIIDDKRYTLLAQQQILNPSKIEIGILNRDFDLLVVQNVENKFPLESCGRFDELVIHYPNSLALKINFRIIKLITETIISTSYKWLEQKVLHLIGSNFIVSQGIYDYLRVIFLKKELVENIWLYASYNNTGLYIIDKPVIEKSLNSFEPLSKKIGLNPLQILTEILEKRLDFNDTASSIVTTNDKTIDFELTKLDYSENNNLFTHAEIAIFGTNAVTGIPIEIEGNYRLVAGIPVNLKEEIEPILNAHREQLKIEYKLIYSRLARFSKSLSNTKTNVNMGKIGEFVGGMIKPFLE